MPLVRQLARLAVLPFVFWLAVLGVVRAGLALPEGGGDPTAVQLRASASAAGDWLLRHQLADGTYRYEWNRDTNTAPDDYNIVRHAGVTMSLYHLVTQAGDDAAWDGAERGLAWMLERLRVQDNWIALTDPEADTSSLGSSALMLVALAERRLASGDEQYDEQMRQLGNFLVAMQREDGGFAARWGLTEAVPDYTSTSIYYPGEATWALALLHEALPDAGFEAPARRALDFVTLERDDVENIKWPPLNDHWAAYALAEMVEWGLSDDHIAYIRRLAGRFSLYIRYEAQKDGGGLTASTRGVDNRAASLGTWVEGMAALWRVTARDERLADLEPTLHDLAQLGAGLLHDRQAGEADGPDEWGAWFADNITRMDDQQHAISGLLFTADALEGDPSRVPNRAQPDGTATP